MDAASLRLHVKRQPRSASEGPMNRLLTDLLVLVAPGCKSSAGPVLTQVP